MKKVFPLIDFTDFTDFSVIKETNTTQIIKCTNKISPYREHILKTFKIKNQTCQDQKKILETFYQVNNQKSQYLLCYSRFSFFSYQSNFQPTFSMKYIQSKPLEELFQNNSINEVWTYANMMNCLFAVAKGMNYLHDHLMCHGNLCPSNIIVDLEKQCYLCDFGLYSIKEIYYDANEIYNEDYKDPKLTGKLEPSFENDVYSFGILMCQFCVSFFKTDSYSTLKDYVTKFDKEKLDFLPSIFLDLIPKCLFLSVENKPTFKNILDVFEKNSYKIGDYSIQTLYEGFSKTNYIEERAKQNDSFALYKLGEMYENGKGLFEKDEKKAMKYYKKAAILGNSKAQNNYGVLLQEGTTDESMRKGAYYLKLSAQQGNINGMANYGVALNDGIGVNRNDKLAREYLKKSADHGLAYAQVNYGFAILNDKDPSPKQIKEGLHYIRMSMNQNYSEAFYTYGILFYYGNVVKQSYQMAMYYFKVAADMGHIQAMLDYADGYYKGDGVEVNKDIALQYYSLAAEKGNERGIEMVDEIKNSTSNKDVSTSDSTENQIKLKKTSKNKKKA